MPEPQKQLDSNKLWDAMGHFGFAGEQPRETFRMSETHLVRKEDSCMLGIFLKA